MKKITVVLDEETIKKFDALRSNKYLRQRILTPEEDAILLKYWPIKDKRTLAKAMKMAVGTCRRRYKELTEGDR